MILWIELTEDIVKTKRENSQSQTKGDIVIVIVIGDRSVGRFGRYA